MTPRRTQITQTVTTLLILFFSGNFCSQKVSADSTPKKIIVRCVDENQQPVAGADVYLFQHVRRAKHYIQLGPFKSDKDGIAECGEVVPSTDGTYDRFIYARVPGKLVGVGRSANWKGQAPFNPENRVRLFPSQSVSGTVEVPPGFDPTTVKVRTQTLHVTHGEGTFAYDSFPRSTHFPGLDIAIPDILDVRPDAKGNFELRDLPVRGRLYLVTSATGLGEGQWRSEGQTINGPIRLTLDRETILKGKVLAPDGTPARGIKVVARLSSRGRIKLSHLTSYPTETDRNGEFTIRGLPRTEFTFSITDPERRWAFRPLEEHFIEPDDSKPMTIEMEPGVHVRGQVTDPDGKPVPAAHFSALTTTQTASGLDHSSTDDDGRFDFLLPAGEAQLYFNALPDGFEYPRPQIIHKLTIESGQDDVEGLKFELKRKPRDEE